MTTQEVDVELQLEYLPVSEERLDRIEDTIKDLSSKVAHLDNSFVEVNITLRDYAGWTKELSNTIKELSNTVRDMNNQHQQIPYDRIRDIQSHIDPIHDILRRHENEFISRKDANVLAAVSIFFISGILVVFGLFGDYVLNDMKDDILQAGKVNKVLIEQNAERIEDHNKIKEKVLNQIHDHRNKK